MFPTFVKYGIEIKNSWLGNDVQHENIEIHNILLGAY